MRYLQNLMAEAKWWEVKKASDKQKTMGFNQQSHKARLQKSMIGSLIIFKILVR